MEQSEREEAVFAVHKICRKAGYTGHLRTDPVIARQSMKHHGKVTEHRNKRKQAVKHCPQETRMFQVGKKV
jgi:hypothetical protein